MTPAQSAEEPVLPARSSPSTAPERDPADACYARGIRRALLIASLGLGCAPSDRGSPPAEVPRDAGAAPSTSGLVPTTAAEACADCYFELAGPIDPPGSLDPKCAVTGLESQPRLDAILAGGAACPEPLLLEGLRWLGSADLWNAGGKIRKQAIAGRIALLGALAERGGPATLERLDDPHFDYTKGLAAARDRTRAAIWKRLALRASASAGTPPRIAVALRIFAWRPEHLPADRLVTDQLRAAGLAPVAADAADVDALLEVTYREYHSTRQWEIGTGTDAALEGHLVDLRAKRVTPIRILGESTIGTRLPNSDDQQAAATAALHDSATVSFRYNLPELVEQVRGGLK